MNTTRAFVGAFLLTTCGGALFSSAQAEIFTRVAVLTGTQEVPPNATTASGYARFVIDTAANTISYRIAYTGLSSAETAAHFHGSADPGVAAGVLVALPAGNPKIGSWTYPEAVEADLLAGRVYVNIHTVNFGGGELRGQVVSAAALLDGGQEVPPNATTGSGFALFNINTATRTVGYYIGFAGLSSPETAAHVHGMALPGTAAGVLVPLPAGSPKVGSFVYTAAQETAFLDGLTYVNIHTTNFGGGELRGQIVTSVNPMDGLQEVPPVPTPAAGGALVSFDRTNNIMGFDIRFANLTSAQTAAHIHGFAPAGTAAGVIFNLGVGTPKRGTWTYGAASAANVLGGLTYANSHTVNFGGGEVRGQILQGSLLPCSPLIDSQPGDVAIAAGGTATFSATANPRTGGNPSYQWRFNGNPLANGGAYSGVNTPSLQVSPVSTVEVGAYSCVVSNTCGGIETRLAQLTIEASCDPDVNQDGNVDQDDVGYLINVVGGGANPTGIDPDFNHDGNADQDDIGALINTVGGGGCP